MSDETPDTTGLREAVAQHLHERFAAEHEPHWRELDESEQADSIYTDMARSLFEPGAPLAVHPDPDASPDPAVVQVVLAALRDAWRDEYSAQTVAEGVTQALGAAAGFGDVRAVEAELTEARRHIQSMERFKHRAEAAEKELADLRERVEALADE